MGIILGIALIIGVILGIGLITGVILGIGLITGIMLSLGISDMSAPPTPSAPPSSVYGTVTGIVDSNTLEIDGVHVRTALVDTPDQGEAGYDNAVSVIERACPVGSPAAYDIDDLLPEDEHGIALAAIWCNKMGKNYPLNDWLLDSGHGTRHCEESEFRLAPWLDGACRRPGE